MTLKTFILMNLMFVAGIAARADLLTYQQEFEKEVVEFANQNRLNVYTGMCTPTVTSQ